MCIARLSLAPLVLTTLIFAPATLASDGERSIAEAPVGWDVSAPNYSARAQEIALSVDQGTWMNLDVSPDGKRIAFDLLGDIYEIPIEGGEASPLLSGHAWEVQPQYSPDGRFLAFTSDRDGADNIWAMEIANPENKQQITHERFRLLNNPTWHPSGHYLAAKKHFTTSRSLGTGEIWLYDARLAQSLERTNLQGSVLVEKPTPSFQKELGEPTFSADGRSVFFIQNTTPGNTFIYHEDSNGEVMAIKRYDLETGEIEKVVGGAGGAVRPTPSPDGKSLAFVKRVRAASRLFILNLESGEQTMLVDDLDPDMQETWAVQGAYPTMAWMPDGKTIIYWSKGKIWRVNVASGAIKNIPFSVNDSRTAYPAVEVAVDVAPDTLTTTMPRFGTQSPDSRSIVFESMGRIYIQRNGADAQRLTRDSQSAHEFSPAFSPDGKDVYFISWSDAELGSIRKVSARGGRSKPVLTTPGHYVDLSVSADGQTLLFAKLSGSALTNPYWGKKPGLYTYDLNDKELAFVSPRGRSPHFGPEGRIYATERVSSAVGRGSDDASSALISMTTAGEDVRTHASSPLATVIRISPTGAHVAYREAGRLYVAALPMTGRTIALSSVHTIASGPTPFVTERISAPGGEFVHWSRDGTSLTWSVGPRFMRYTIDDSLGTATTKATQIADLSLRVESDRPEGLVAFINARVITMNEARDTLESGVVVVRENRIESVGRMGEIVIPSEAKIVDLGGKTLLPGYIDAHAHGPYARDDIIPQNNWSLLAHLALGVTTVHNPSSRAAQVFPAAEYQRAGVTLGPRIFSTGEIIYGAKSTGFDPIESLDDAKTVVDRLKAQGAISVKNYNQPRRAQRQMVIEAARDAGMLVVAEGGSLYNMDMNLVADGSTGIEHNIPTLKIYDDVRQFWSSTNVGYTPTLVVTYGGLTSEDRYYRDTEVWKHPLLAQFVPPTVLQPRSVRRVTAPEPDFRDDDAAAVAKELMALGVTVNTGAHGQREGLATHWEMWSFSEGGMSPMEMLSTATINPAKYLGMEADLGSVEPGKLADLQIVDGNPLDNVKTTDQITHVMINGRLYRSSDLAETVTGEAEAPRVWWHGQAQHRIR
jgi:imidazolonepropionase-like amidohydrolase/Tol biopolymer transport system component